MALDLQAPSIVDLPVIPDTFPSLPTPKRNVCWVLREMRHRFQTKLARWITRRATDDLGGYCLIGLADEVAGKDARLYSATIFQLSRAVKLRYARYAPVDPAIGPDTLVPQWNDHSAIDVNDVCRLIAQAEEIAERDGYCEP